MLSRVLLALLLLISFACSKAPSGDVAAGKAKFDQNCALCHGPEGKGDGPGSQGLNPKPRNFHDAAYMNTRTDEQLHKVIKDGGAASGFSAVMPPWGTTLNDQDINNVIAYIRTFSK
jgi:mono/diheme cytochrome c family protein